MRILLLCKQKYMRRDVIKDRYGRLYELPVQISRSHDVKVITLDYRPGPGFRFSQLHMDETKNVIWCSLKLNLLIIPTLIQYWIVISRELRKNPPDILIGASDSLHIILAFFISRIFKVKLLLDLYDNFEAFGLSKIPGVKYFYRRALANADAVTCVSNILKDQVKASYRQDRPVFTIESTINNTEFFPIERDTARSSLALECGRIYIGTAGALYASRGIDIVYAAFLEVLRERPEASLLLAGEIDPGCPPPESDSVHFLGELPHDKMNSFFNALDIGIIYMRDDEFGRYSFPQKAYEILACRKPVLCARVGVFPELFKQDKKYLYDPEDVQSLKERIIGMLEQPGVPEVNIPTWNDQASRLEEILRKLAE